MIKNRFAWIGAVIAAVALFGGAFIIQMRASTRGSEWGRAEKGNVRLGVEVTGELEALDTAALGPPDVPQMWQFRISMLAPEGSDVKKGQPVIGFDSSDLQRKLQEKSAERDSARTEIEKRRASLRVESQEETLRRAEAESRLRKAALKLEAPEDVMNARQRRELELEHALARRELDYRTSKLKGLREGAREELRLLEARFHAANREVERLQNAIASLTIRSPREGTVVYVVDPRRNEKKKVGDDTWRGHVILQIPDLRRMIASGRVDEADAGKVTRGQRAVIRLDAHPDREWLATVSKVGHTVRRESNTNPNRTLAVGLELAQVDPEIMRPGMRFRGTLVNAERRGVLRIPADALFTSSSGPAVRVRTPFGFREVPVQIGVRGEEWVEVVSGISDGVDVMLRSGNGEGKAAG